MNLTLLVKHRPREEASMDTNSELTGAARLRSELTSTHAEAIRRFTVSGPGAIVVEVDEATAVDWPGVAALYSLAQRARRAGGTVRIHGTCSRLSQMLRAQGLDRLVVGAGPARPWNRSDARVARP